MLVIITGAAVVLYEHREVELPLGGLEGAKRRYNQSFNLDLYKEANLSEVGVWGRETKWAKRQEDRASDNESDTLHHSE